MSPWKCTERSRRWRGLSRNLVLATEKRNAAREKQALSRRRCKLAAGIFGRNKTHKMVGRGWSEKFNHKEDRRMFLRQGKLKGGKGEEKTFSTVHY